MKNQKQISKDLLTARQEFQFNEKVAEAVNQKIISDTEADALLDFDHARRLAIAWMNFRNQLKGM